jgi:hypothetical protein
VDPSGFAAAIHTLEFDRAMLTAPLLDPNRRRLRAGF